MLCIAPFRKASAEFGCGQCLACRINKRRTWTARIVLESLAHPHSSFVTLTYSDEHLPRFGSLSREHWREFSKGIGYRYFGCGEYGSRTLRAHYHVILFGCDPLAAERLALARWPYGFITASPFVLNHASYVAAYTVKKMAQNGSKPLPEGCIPEFARMSRRPGVGIPGMGTFGQWLTTRAGCEYLSRHLDVPAHARIAGSFFPIGRLLRDWLRSQADIPSDLPVRTMSREAQYKAEQSLPELVALKEGKRVAQYERARARAQRPHGTL